MERIRKALEQAEIDRQKAGVSESPDDPKIEEAAAANEPVGPPKPIIRSSSATDSSISLDVEDPSLPDPDLVYTRTRCVDVSPSLYREKNIVAALPGHELQDTYRMLRTRINKVMRANGWKMIMVTGAHRGAGKSMTAVNLAIAMSMDVNSYVMLVDADLRQPSIHEYFGYQPELGFGDYLKDGAPIEDMLFHPNGLDRLVVLPGNGRIENSAEMLASPRAEVAAAEFKTRYVNRVVIVDAPPILNSDDVTVTDGYIDAVLLVAEAGVTKREELQECLRVLGNIPVLGTVLNKSTNSTVKERD
ncbi:MAG: CpsD/CapB family tyrosine-protein kinase [Chromatiales bacterium]|jgi:protein-tyrosine kinase|nr:CpsD/CapB family tyrosine-protein kinase [Chromatiales bacterium]